MSIDYSYHNQDRLRRAKSWLQQADKQESDEAAFLFYWIAFNAAYGRVERQDENEKRLFAKFSRQIVFCDEEKIKTALNSIYSEIRKLTQNRHTYEPFWRAIRGDKIKSRYEETNWKTHLKKTNKKLQTNWSRDSKNDKGHQQGIIGVIREALIRIYTLRNQLIHGGTTFGSASLGDEQLVIGRKIMEAILPPIIEIIEQDIERQPDTNKWGTVAYPRYKNHPISNIPIYHAINPAESESKDPPH